ncbi:MAG: phosphotransferase [Trebonia sp.]
MVAAGHPLGDDPVVRRAYETSAAWLGEPGRGDQSVTGGDAVLGQGDCNLANFLWDGTRVRLVDFEDSGPSDRAFELGTLVEHLSAWLDAGLRADAFLGYFGLSCAERARVLHSQRLSALFWLILLRPGGPASARNPPGTLRRQAERLLALHD